MEISLGGESVLKLHLHSKHTVLVRLYFLGASWEEGAPLGPTMNLVILNITVYLNTTKSEEMLSFILVYRVNNVYTFFFIAPQPSATLINALHAVVCHGPAQ